MNWLTSPCKGVTNSVQSSACLALFYLAAFPGPSNAESLTLSEELSRIVPKIYQTLQSNPYESIGVLKFVGKEAGKQTDRGAELYLAMADWLTEMLCLQYDPQKPLRVVRNANAIAATINGADHCSEDPAKRKKLFDKKYPLAGSGKWNGPRFEPEMVKPKGFLTGEIEMTPDRQSLKISFYVVDPEGCVKPLAPAVPPVEAPVGALVLAQFQNSMWTRGGPDGKPAGPTRISDLDADAGVQIKKIAEGNQVHPLAKGGNADLDLVVKYNGTVQTPRFDAKDRTIANIDTPKEGARVTLVVKRRGASKERFAVVVKVNGENTLYKETASDQLCHKWVLEPGTNEVEIKGFQIKGEEFGRESQETNPFKVLSEKESKEKASWYAPDSVGTIRMTVFREGSSPVATYTGEKGQQIAAIESGFLPDAADPGSLKRMLKMGRKDLVQLGLMEAEEKREKSPIKWIDFKNPVPVGALVITYYRAKQ